MLPEALGISEVKFRVTPGLTCCPELGDWAGCFGEEGRDLAPVPSPGAGSCHPRAMCPFPGLVEVQVGAGFSAYLPVCQVWMTLETEAVFCIQLSAAVIVSAQRLLGDPHKVPRPHRGPTWLLEMGVHTVLLNPNDCIGCWGLIPDETLVDP